MTLCVEQNLSSLGILIPRSSIPEIPKGSLTREIYLSASLLVELAQPDEKELRYLHDTCSFLSADKQR